MPTDYRYPYPDFLQVVYVAEAAEYIPEAKIADEYVAQSFLHPLGEVHVLEIPPIERMCLDAAVRLRRSG
jgi:hypothetical protein